MCRPQFEDENGIARLTSLKRRCPCAVPYELDDGQGIDLVLMSEMAGEDSAYSLPHLQCLKGTPCTESKRTLVHVTDSAKGQDVQDDVVRRRPMNHRPDTLSRTVFLAHQVMSMQ